MNPLNRARQPVRAGAMLAVALTGTILLLGSPAVAHGDGHAVEIKQYMYRPMALSIEQGETVTWTNQDTAAHDVTVVAGPTSFHSPMLAQGASWSHTFTTPGSYSYICSVHPDMRATISVAAAAPSPVATSRSEPTSRPGRALERRPVATSAAATRPRAAVRARPATASSRAPATAAAQGATPALVDAPQSAATLQPLILVVGAAVAVVMFCL